MAGSLSPYTPHPFQALHVHPGECQKPSMPGQLLQEHSKASSNVTARPRFSLRLSGVHLLWTHSTLYKFPLKSSQTTFLNTCCITGTLCWALENIKITLRPRLYPYGSHSLVGDRQARKQLQYSTNKGKTSQKPGQFSRGLKTEQFAFKWFA